MAIIHTKDIGINKLSKSQLLKKELNSKELSFLMEAHNGLTAKIVELVESHNLNILHVHYAVPHAYAAVNAKKILESLKPNPTLSKVRFSESRMDSEPILRRPCRGNYGKKSSRTEI